MTVIHRIVSHTNVWDWSQILGMWTAGTRMEEGSGRNIGTGTNAGNGSGMMIGTGTGMRAGNGAGSSLKIGTRTGTGSINKTGSGALPQYWPRVQGLETLRAGVRPGKVA